MEMEEKEVNKNCSKKKKIDRLYVTETFRLKLDVKLEDWLNITGNGTISGKIDRLVISIMKLSSK